MEFTEYSVFDLNWTDKKAEAKNTRLVRNVKNSLNFLNAVLYKVLKCDIIKLKFLKSWDLSGYSEGTMSKRPTCQK